MSSITLQPGESLRIRGGTRLYLVLRAASAWEVRVVRRGLATRIARKLLAGWLRMHRLGAATGRRWAQARRERVLALELAELDPRILKDIGLDPHNGGSLGRRVYAYQERELLRLKWLA